MKTMIKVGALALAIAVTGLESANGQVSVASNNPPFGSYVGHIGANPNPVEVRHNGNQPIEWYTDSIQRMRLSPNVNSAMGPSNQYPSVNRNGYLLLSNQPDAFTNAASRAPFTRLHLIDSAGTSVNPTVYAQQQGYRLWQRNGVTFTGNSDQSYVGAKYDGNDNSDLVLQWSDNPENSIYGTDRLRFLFTNVLDVTKTYGARCEEGLESFRVHVPNDTTANVGIGDWWHATVLNGGIPVDPDEQLDVLDRTVRIRRLVPDYRNDTLSKAVVVDSDGRLHWRAISSFPTGGGGGGADCDWTMMNEGVSGPAVPHYLSTALGTDDLCPDATDLVGIGVHPTVAKLQLAYGALSGSTIGTGHRVDVTGDRTSKVAGDYFVSGTGNHHVGLRGKASGAFSSDPFLSNIGVLGLANTSADGVIHTQKGGFFAAEADQTEVTNNIGVDAAANSGAGTVVINTIGVRGLINEAHGVSTNIIGGAFDAKGPCNDAQNIFGVQGFARGGQIRYGVFGWTNTNLCGGVSYAGFFSGDLYAATGPWSPSDEQLKTDLQPVEAASADELLQQLEVVSYVFNTAQYPSMSLPEDRQVGLRAQQVAEVFPALVKETRQPAMVDVDGNETAPSVDFKAVNYTGMIPYLIAGHQSSNTRVAELEDQLAAQNERLDQLESMLLDCCNRNSSPDGDRSLQQDQGSLNERLNERTMQVVPNPFQTETTIHYNLEKGGRVQLMANSADGKQLRVLSEATSVAGVYQFNWNTADLAAGMYYVTLLLDGEPITKRAVKIDR